MPGYALTSGHRLGESGRTVRGDQLSVAGHIIYEPHDLYGDGS